MAKTYNELRTLSFEFTPDVTELPYETQALALPESYKEPLQRARSAYKRRFVPVDSLNNSVRALVPDIISVEGYAYKKGNGWLHSRKKIDTEKIHAIICAWVEAEYKKLDGRELTRLLENLKLGELTWQRVRTDLAAWRGGENGTARPRDSLTFSLLPDRIAQQLSQHTYSVGSQTLTFFRTTGGATSRHAELISWPPTVFDNSGKKGGSKVPENWLSSFFIRTSVQTLPNIAMPRIYIHLGVKRWVSGRQLYLPYGHKTSVYLKTEIPWIEGVHGANTFTVAQAEKYGGQHQWANKLAPILADLSTNEEVFSIKRLDNPREAINIQGIPNMAVVHHHEMGRHGAPTGVFVRDRKELAEQITAILAPEFSPSTAPIRVKVKRSLFTNPKPILTELPKAGSEQNKTPNLPFTAANYSELRTRVSQSVGEEVRLELWTQTPEIKQALLSEIERVFGLPIEETDGQLLSSPELRIRLQVNELGALGGELEVERDDDKKRAKWAVDKRIGQVAQKVDNTSLPTLALIEINNKDKFINNSRSDPKEALRIGFGKKDRVTQFIVPGSDTITHRAKAAFWDGLRQLGFAEPIPALKAHPDMRYLALWILRQQNYKGFIPVALMMSADGTLLKCTSPCLSGQWISYKDILLKAAKRELEPIHKDSVAPFIRRLLDVECSGSIPTLLLIRAQNIRSVWPWAQDSKVKRNVRLFDDDERFSISRWPGLRVARIRDDKNDETPEWYAENEESYSAIAKGLFEIEDAIFASIANKPDTQQPNKKMSRFFREDGDGNTSKPAWNTGIKQVFLAGLQPEDNAKVWATLVDKLRESSSHTTIPTALPDPLHLARKIDEYTRLL